MSRAQIFILSLAAFMLPVICNNKIACGQSASERIATIVDKLQRMERLLGNYSASIEIEDRQISLKGKVEFLQGSQVFVGKFKNKPSPLVPTTGWLPIEFGVFGGDSQVYFPNRRLCSIYRDNSGEVPGQFPLNPTSLFTKKPLDLFDVLKMPGEATFVNSPASENIQVLLRFPALIALGETAGVHEALITWNALDHPLQVTMKGGAVGNSTFVISWEQSPSGNWFPRKQEFFWVGVGQSVDLKASPFVQCELSDFEIELGEYEYLPASVKSRLPFGTLVEEYGSAFVKNDARTILKTYVGGKEGELQHILDSISEGLRKD